MCKLKNLFLNGFLINFKNVDIYVCKIDLIII